MMISSRVPTIGYVTPSIYSAYHRLLLAGVQQAAGDRGARLQVFQMTTGDVSRSRVSWGGIDGWVVCYSHLNLEPFDDRLAPNRPVVMISEYVPGRPTVVIDNRGGMRDMTRHLLELGHRRIVFVGFSGNPDYPDRLAGYRMACAEYGVEFDPALVLTTPTGAYEDGVQCARRLLDTGLPGTAIAFTTDTLALGALQVFREAGIRVPDDLALVGFDDMPEAQIATPPLTTVRMRFDAMGRAAAEHLLDILAGATPATDPIVIPATLVVRGSAGERIAQAVDQPHSESPDDYATLARSLAELVAAPQTLAPNEPASRLWPGVETIIQTLAAALDGGEPPDDSALQEAWALAVRSVAYADPLDDAVARIEAAFASALAGRPEDDPARRRAAIAMRRLRVALMRVTLGGQVRRINRSELALSGSDRIARVLADCDLETACRLGWLAHSEVVLGALALWENDTAGGRLRLVGRYPEPLRGEPIVLTQFPPPELSDVHGTEALVVLPLQSARRDWGLLALVMPADLETAAFDNSPLIAALLTARIDSATYQREREAQQEMLRGAYERERALADTVRELGSPVIPVGTSMLLVPLIGVIDSQRAQEIITTLLRAIETERTREVILDVSGVPLIDTHVAGMLLRLARMSRLLGARTTLVGVRPEIAQSIVSLGVDLGGLTAYASLVGALAALEPTREE